MFKARIMQKTLFLLYFFIIIFDILMCKYVVIRNCKKIFGIISL